MSKYSTSCSPALGSSLWELSSFGTVSINITSLSSSLVQISLVLDNGGTNPSNLKNELNLRTFSVMNVTDGSGGVGGLTWIFFGSSSSSLFSFSSSSQEAFYRSWKESSKDSGSKILPCGDGSRWKTFKPISSLIAEGKLKKTQARSFPIFAVKVKNPYTKDFPLKKEGKTIKEAYYTQFGGPYQGGGYRAAAIGFNQKNNANLSYQEGRQSMEEILSKLMIESAKRHEEGSNMIKEIRALTDAVIRNQGLGELAQTKLTIELADRTVKYPKGIAKNVLVGLRERMELDLKARKDQVDYLIPIIEEGEVIDEPMIDIIKTRYVSLTF
nr:hypothetical protein [Tanacetum cinerariifolium]